MAFTQFIANSAGGANVDERLTEYAVKHAAYHFTDAGKQAENVARVLCSLRYVQQKLKLTPKFPGSVAVQYVLDDYEHSHYQVIIIIIIIIAVAVDDDDDDARMSLTGM